jgi:hypothetical protein
MVHLLDNSDDYAAIVSFARSAKASALSLLLRRANCAELTVTPYWRLPGNDALELRILATDGSLTCCRHSAKMGGVVQVPVVDAGLLETLLPRAAARVFAVALEADQLRKTIAAQLELSGELAAAH